MIKEAFSSKGENQIIFGESKIFIVISCQGGPDFFLPICVDEQRLRLRKFIAIAKDSVLSVTSAPPLVLGHLQRANTVVQLSKLYLH